MFLDRVIQFGEALGDQLKGRSPKKLKSLIEVPNVVHVKVHVLSFNMIVISFQKRGLTPSYPFLGQFRIATLYVIPHTSSDMANSV